MIMEYIHKRPIPPDFKWVDADMLGVGAGEHDPVHWNGSCKVCGKGTYTGFSSVEHDGACK